MKAIDPVPPPRPMPPACAFTDRQHVIFDFSIGDLVRIRATDHPGQVTGCMVDDNGKQYRTLWWNNGERKREWLWAFEIERQTR